MKSIISCILILISGATQVKAASPFGVLLDHYLEIKDALVKDQAGLASKSADLYLKELDALMSSKLKPGDKAALQEQLKILKGQTIKIKSTTSLDDQREAFKSFSVAMWNLIKDQKDLSYPVFYQYCSMKKAYWLSREEKILNPYYGKKMLGCGSVKHKTE